MLQAYKRRGWQRMPDRAMYKAHEKSIAIKILMWNDKRV